MIGIALCSWPLGKKCEGQSAKSRMWNVMAEKSMKKFSKKYHKPTSALVRRGALEAWIAGLPSISNAEVFAPSSHDGAECDCTVRRQTPGAHQPERAKPKKRALFAAPCLASKERDDRFGGGREIMKAVSLVARECRRPWPDHCVSGGSASRRRDYCSICPGNQVANSGTAISRARTSNSIRMKGRADITTSPSVTRNGAMPFMT